MLVKCKTCEGTKRINLLLMLNVGGHNNHEDADDNDKAVTRFTSYQTFPD